MCQKSITFSKKSPDNTSEAACQSKQPSYVAESNADSSKTSSAGNSKVTVSITNAPISVTNAPNEQSGNSREVKDPMPVEGLAHIDVMSASCGRAHMLALSEGGVYGWGGNTYGQVSGQTVLSPMILPRVQYGIN